MTMPWGDRQAMLIMPTEKDPPTSAVREWIGDALVAVPRLVRMRAAFVTAELVTNARRHGSAPYVLHLSVRELDRTLLVAVDDSTPELGASWAHRSGLVLVGGLSKRWGVERRARGKTVWAELSFDSAAADLTAPDQPSRNSHP